MEGKGKEREKPVFPLLGRFGAILYSRDLQPWFSIVAEPLHHMPTAPAPKSAASDMGGLLKGNPIYSLYLLRSFVAHVRVFCPP